MTTMADMTERRQERWRHEDAGDAWTKSEEIYNDGRLWIDRVKVFDTLERMATLDPYKISYETNVLWGEGCYLTRDRWANNAPLEVRWSSGGHCSDATEIEIAQAMRLMFTDALIHLELDKLDQDKKKAGGDQV